MDTAYEMRVSDWSSDVCSSDLLRYRSGCGASLRGVHGRSADRFALASAERGPAHLRLGTDAYGVAPPQFWAQDDSAAIRSEWPTGRRRGRDGCLCGTWPQIGRAHV